MSSNQPSVVLTRVTMSSSRAPSPLPEGVYEVEEIVDYHDELYRVKWKGYDEADNTWEPVDNLGCPEELLKFYQKRKLDASTDAGKRKRPKLAVPPDPRPLSIIINEYFEKCKNAPSFLELNENYRVLQLQDNKSKQRWTEVKIKKSIEDAVDGKLSDEKLQELRKQAVFFLAEAAGKEMFASLKAWEVRMNATSQRKPIIVTENKIDLIGPPIDFTYINDYLPTNGIEIPEDPPMGCQCQEDCAGKKTKKSSCCSNQFGDHDRGYYSSKKLMLAKPGTPIYECNKKCLCSSKCSNRVVQDGVLPLTDKKFCIFKTEHCGWGVKSLKRIRKGSYVCMYVGEIISDEVANTRGAMYDQEGTTYLFDLDFNQTEENDCPYVVDAKKYGNISHFFNHSCDPNLVVYGVWSNCLDPNLPKLALFAIKDIPEGTELTFSYKNSKGDQIETSEADTPEDLPLIKRKECHCGSDECQKYLF